MVWFYMVVKMVECSTQVHVPNACAFKLRYAKLSYLNISYHS